MKKHYTGLVDGIKLVAVMIAVFGVLGGIIVIAYDSRNAVSGFGVIAASLLAALFWNGMAAIIDLLADIHINSAITAIYFEKRIQPKE